jgi:murein L,D-transpeptidase YcbB/YkuD
MERRHRDHRREADSAERVEAAGAQEQILSLYSAIGNAAFSRLVAPEPKRAVLRVAKGRKKSRERWSEAPAAPAGEPMLRQGSRGPSVAALQADLVVCGFEIAVDGIFGPQTDGAVRGFQAEEGLDADGIVGPLTRAALLRRGGGSLPPVAPTPTAGSLPGLEAAPPGKGGKKQSVF